MDAAIRGITRRRARRARNLATYTWCALVSLCLVVPPLASARSCTASQRHLLDVAAQDSAYLVAHGSAGNLDAVQLVNRALSRCSSANAVQVLVHATRFVGSPRVGQVRRVRWFVLVGEPASGGTGWRLDLPAMLSASLAATSPRSRAHRLKRVRGLAFISPGRISWSADPTRRSTRPAAQAKAARTLALKGHRADALATALSFRSQSQRRATLQLDLLSAMSVAIDLSVAAGHLDDARLTAAAHGMDRSLLTRVRASDSGAWSRPGGVWSTLAGHRALIARGTALVRYVDQPVAETTIASLRHELVTKPVVKFQHVPGQPFYPWPLDGTLDASSLTVSVDKPSVMTMKVFDVATGTVVHSNVSELIAGTWSTGWDGTNAHGITMPQGQYRYSLIAADLAGNRLSVPGLNAFVIARDTTPPKINVAQVKLRSSNRRTRQLRVRWNVTEPLSPLIHVTLMLTPGSGAKRMIELDGNALGRTTAVPVSLAGGRWRTTLVVTDGSGNRASAYAGALLLPH